MVKGNCPRTCGGVAIPFPFGIGSGCFLDEWYEIICQKGSDGIVPILKKPNLRVLNISLPNFHGRMNSMISVSLPIFYSSNVTCGGNGSFTPVSLKGSQFIFSESMDVFTAVGCDVSALLDDTKSAIIGCQSKCEKGDNVIRKMNCSGSDGCCHTTITSDLQAFNITFNPDKRTAKKKCEYAFLGERSQFTPGPIDFNKLEASGRFPLVLEWGITEFSQAALEIYRDGSISGDSYNCSSQLQSSESQGDVIAACYCRGGFTGNPYIRHGCEDVDECKDQTERCPGKKCVNRPGSYDCVGGSKIVKFLLIDSNMCPGTCVNKLRTYHCVDRKKTTKFVFTVTKALGEAVDASSTAGFGAGLVHLLLLCRWLYKVIKKRREIKQKEKYFKKQFGLLLQRHLSSSPEGNVAKSKLFRFKDLDKATDRFNEDRILGQGGQGVVYKGMLTDGKIVAVKKSKLIDKEKVEEFINEVIILSQIDHRNVVKLIGCCLETEIPHLVYEFIPNGTLYKYMHDLNEDLLASWDTRLRIATEIAEALFYLHSAASTPIYHHDIKSTNILLDEKHRAKVADFGISKSISLDQTHVTTLVRGTFGYLDPEYFRTGHFTDKSDAYSFGVVLVELLTGEMPISLLREEEERSLANYFVISMELNHLFDIVDAQVMEEGKKEEIVAVANLARRCLSSIGRNRPTMKEVAMELEGLRKLRSSSSFQRNPEKIEASESRDSRFASGKSFMDTSATTFSDVQPFAHCESW
ncbi:LOW QUALITY PROTEIN: hypothetical protein BT93_K1217 [Corymbia citriodora subsp. variegata]|nr:LOW QUALITY PROTEIN: hypothetical protein BT93_K1217 [Corymbia citriodora subsp. variegata]